MNIRSANVWTEGDRGNLDFGLGVQNQEQLATLMHSLEAIPHVHSVERITRGDVTRSAREHGP